MSNYTEELSSKYLVLGTDVSLHLLPGGCVIFYDEKWTNYSILPKGMLEVNSSAASILSQFNGESTLGEIVERISMEEGGTYEENIKPVLEFISEISKTLTIAAHDEPQRGHAVKITGSTKYRVPTHMMIEITDHCNLRCKHCYADCSPVKQSSLSTEDLLRIIADVADSGTNLVELTGGEPLTHPDFFEILDVCSKKFDIITLATNGFLLDEEAAAKIGRYKPKIIAQVSLDGSTPDIHDLMRGREGSFARATKAIRLLAEHNVPTRVAMCVTPINVEDQENTLLLSKKLGAKWFASTPVLDIGRGNNPELFLTPEQWIRSVEIRKRLMDEYSDFFFTMPPLLKEMSERLGNCGVGYRTCVVGADGKVRPCSMLPSDYIAIGDLKKETAAQVFSSPLVEYFQNLKAPDEESCGNCMYVPYCKTCITRPIYMYERIGSECTWVKDCGLSQFITVAEDKPALDELGFYLPTDIDKILESQNN